MFPTAATIAFAALFTIWNRKGWINTAIKFAFLGLTAWGSIEALLAWGYILAPQSN